MQRAQGVYLDAFGRPIGAATVSVFNAGTPTLATIYQAVGDPLAPSGQPNPFTTDSTGTWSFAAPNGRYDIQIQSNIAATEFIPNVFLSDLGSAFLANPMTAQGDMIGGGPAGAVNRVPANTTATPMYVFESNGAIPVFKQIQGSEIAGLAGVSVTSFNGRIGAVVPANGDYSASQITGLAAFIAANGVASFNGRIGTVTPMAGDYTASQVAFTAPFAGSTSQFQQDRNSNFVCLTDFMSASQLADVEAKTGAVDMSSAFTAAISYIASIVADSHTPYGAGYANNRPTLMLPGCTLKVTQGFNITFRGFRMVGQGKGNTAIYYNTNSPIVLFDFGTFSATPSNLFAGTAQQWSIEELTLIHSNGETAGSRTCSAIRDNGCGDGHLKNTLLVGWQYGLNAVYGSDFTTTDGADFSACDNGIYFGPGCQQVDVIDSQFYLCYNGVTIEYGQEINMRRPVFTGPQNAAIYIYNQASGTTQLTSFPGQSGWSPLLNSSIIAPHFESNPGGIGATSIPTYFVLVNGTVAWTNLFMRDADIVGGNNGTNYVNAFLGNTGSAFAQYIWMENVTFTGGFAVGGTAPGYMFHNAGNNCYVKNLRAPAGYTLPNLADTGTGVKLVNDFAATRQTMTGALPFVEQVSDSALTTGVQTSYLSGGQINWGFYTGAAWSNRMGMDIQNKRFYFGDVTAPGSNLTFDVGTAIPGSGTYFNGSFRFNNGAPNNTGWTLLGWSRLTTGSANVAGTDWMATYVPQQVLGGAVSSAATITPTAPLFHVTGTTQINTINLPYTGFIGSITVIPDGLFTTGTTGNIALASTAVVSKSLVMTYDGTKWYPSY